MRDPKKQNLAIARLRGNAGNRLATTTNQNMQMSSIIINNASSVENKIMEDISESYDNEIQIDNINNEKWLRKLENERKRSSQFQVIIENLQNEIEEIRRERDEYEQLWINLAEKQKNLEWKIRNENRVIDDTPPLIIHSVGVLKDNVKNLRIHLEDKYPLVDIQLKKLVYGCEAKEGVTFKARCINPQTMDGDITFAIHIFGPGEKIKTFKIAKTNEELGSFQEFSFNMINFETQKALPSGKYRLALMNRHFVSLRNKSQREISNVSDFVVRRRDIYFTFDCPEEIEEPPFEFNMPDLTRPDQHTPQNIYQFKEGYEVIHVKRSEGLVHIPVIRQDPDERFSFGWQANLNKDNGNLGDHSGGYGYFNELATDTRITVRFDQVYKPNEFSVIDVILRDHEALGERMHSQIRVENDIESCEVGFIPAKPFVGTFNGGDTVELKVVRSTTDQRIDVKWCSLLKTQVLAALRQRNACLDTAAVSISVREDRLFWNRQEGRVRFEIGQETAIIRLKIPVAAELCMEEMHVEIHLEKYRGSSNEGIIIDQENDVRSFKIMYDECKTPDDDTSDSSSNSD